MQHTQAEPQFRAPDKSARKWAQLIAQGQLCLVAEREPLNRNIDGDTDMKHGHKMKHTQAESDRAIWHQHSAALEKRAEAVSVNSELPTKFARKWAQLIAQGQLCLVAEREPLNRNIDGDTGMEHGHKIKHTQAESQFRAPDKFARKWVQLIAQGQLCFLAEREPLNRNIDGDTGIEHGHKMKHTHRPNSHSELPDKSDSERAQLIAQGQLCLVAEREPLNRNIDGDTDMKHGHKMKHTQAESDRAILHQHSAALGKRAEAVLVNSELPTKFARKWAQLIAQGQLCLVAEREPLNRNIDGDTGMKHGHKMKHTQAES
ncbi:hypothetical protein DVH05_012549 [Phytophthora capsici]|nr:hypothetical protein DVH05_012549 [Phytophthora capsici]